jgi:cation transport protein ChaC
MDDTPHKLSRAMLLRGDLAEIAARAAPGMRLWSAAEREASWRATLAANPDPQAGVWLFAYGSLLWNPTVHVAARRRATAEGWHRAFCLLARAGRGSAANPGLLLGLLPGRRCEGVALQVQPEGLEAEIDLLWRREMLAGSYVPRWVALSGEAGPSHAIAFTVDPAGPAFAGDLPEDEVVARLSTACGELGTCLEYLLHTRDALRAEGIHDPDLERLATRVLG